MRRIKEVLRLAWEAGLSSRMVARSCGIGGTTAREYLHRAREAGLAWPLPAGLTDGELERLLFPSSASRPMDGRPSPDWQHLHEELKGRGVTLFVLWEEYKAAHPDGLQYSRFCDLYRAWRGKLPVWMRQDHKAGEKMFIDYAGMTMPVRDGRSGETRQSQIFVAALGASYYTYAEPTWTQTLPDFIASHVRAFSYFGGVSELLVPDNLRSAVSRSCRYDPDANPTYLRMADYGTAIMPARACKPTDKSRVESSVNGVEQRMLAKLRNRVFFGLEELNQAMAPLLAEYNERPFQEMEGSRRSLFEKLEKPALKPLPQCPFEYEEWEKARVNLDYHVHVRADEHYYSVPYRLVHEVLHIRLTAAMVECFHKNERVAVHARSGSKHHHTTQREHMPESHRAHAEWDPGRILRWVEKSGPAAAQVAEAIMASRAHPEQGYRACLGIIRLGEQCGAERLEAACLRALALQSPSYRTVKEILKQGLDKQPLPEKTPPTPAIEHENVRGADYYETTN